MTIKLIATDMDGTLLRDDRTFDYARMEDLLDELDSKGIRFVAASGNQYKKLRSYFNPVNPDRVTYVSDNGALVMDHDEVIAESTITRQQIDRVIAWNNSVNPGMENLIVLSGHNGAYVSNHATPEIIGMVKQFYPVVHQVEKFKDIEDNIFRFTFVWEQGIDVHQHIQQLRAEFGEELHTTGSGFGTVDILAPGVNKRTGLEQLGDIWGIKPEEMAAFGDNGNDLEMLRYVKYPFVMPNAEDFMKVRIDNLAVNDNNHNGVLDTIEALLAGAFDDNASKIFDK
jgi:Cof subfamily protein (haloacid dehalogenase superfamily)